jgi:uncharacterized cupin superfamily protein
MKLGEDDFKAFQTQRGIESFEPFESKAGEKFTKMYDKLEIVLLTEGQATVTSTTMPSKKIQLEPGVIAYFPKGLEAHWNVAADVSASRKVYQALSSIETR